MSVLRVQILVVGLLSIVLSCVASAQTQGCTLQVKVFSYNAMETGKSRVPNATVLLTAKAVRMEKQANATSQSFDFEGLKSGPYELKIKRAGFKDKEKSVDLDCKYAVAGVIKHSIYLWKGKSNVSNGTELLIDGFGEETEIKDKDLSSTKSDKPGIFGSVKVDLLIDEDGNVVRAKAVSGKSELFDAAVTSARRANFRPTLFAGSAVKVSGFVTYNFVP